MTVDYNDAVALEKVETLFEEFNKKISPFWQFAFGNVSDRNKIVFVGINPSKDENVKHNEPYNAWDKGHKYFIPFQKLATDVKCEKTWSHIDLFYHRETSQEGINELMHLPNPDFLSKQLCITQGRLESIKPHLIVVCNGKAAEFFGVNASEEKNQGVWMGYKFDFNEELGTHVIKKDLLKKEWRIYQEIENTNLAGTPVIFTSMLKYQSKPALERLAWQIRRIKRKLDF